VVLNFSTYHKAMFFFSNLPTHLPEEPIFLTSNIERPTLNIEVKMHQKGLTTDCIQQHSATFRRYSEAFRAYSEVRFTIGRTYTVLCQMQRKTGKIFVFSLKKQFMANGKRQKLKNL
jgi:hypothetical protein